MIMVDLNDVKEFNLNYSIVKWIVLCIKDRNDLLMITKKIPV